MIELSEAFACARQAIKTIGQSRLFGGAAWERPRGVIPGSPWG
jgi:hypothetical protein